MGLNTKLLEKLEQSLGDVLVAADSLKGRKPWKTSIINAVRKLRITRELNQRYYIAITGTQGAGKTRLIRALYDLDNTWLDDNSGRGEKVPIFIVEKEDIKVPQGAVLRVNNNGGLEEAEVEASAFKKIVVSWGDDGGNLFPLLYVPRKYFCGSSVNSAGFVLLPGFERESSQNGAWQILMKYVLEYASGSIIVTDQTRLADHSQDQVRNVATSGKVPGLKPIVAISKTEHVDEPTREELRRCAAERFDVGPLESDRIVCTGVGAADFEQAWASELMRAMEKYVMLGMNIKAARYETLDSVVDGEVPAIHEEIKLALDEDSLAAVSDEDHLNRILDPFRKARADYRIRYEKNLGKRTRALAAAAKKEARGRYEKEEEGFINSMHNAGRWFSTTSGERDRLHIERIEECWKKPYPSDGKSDGIALLESDWRAVGDQSKHYLQISFDEGKAGKIDDVADLLGYNELAEQGKLAVLSNPALVSELRKLLCFDPNEGLGKVPLVDGRLGDVLKLVPALTMEYLRINQSLLLIHQDHLPDKPTPKSLGEFMSELAKDLPAVNTMAKTLLSTIGSILAVDVAIDGTVDTIPGLIHAAFVGTTATAAASAGTGAAATSGAAVATTLGATLSMVAAAAIVVGVVAYKGTRHVQQLDAAHRGYINVVIDQCAEAHVQEMLDVYDDSMDLIENRIHDNLCRAYRLDQTVSITDTLMRSLASLERARLSALGGLRAEQLLA